MRVLLIALTAAVAGCGASCSSAPPSFFALGGDVYHEKDRLDVEKQILHFADEPRWFAGFPKEVTQEQYVAWEKQQGSISQQEPPVGERANQIPAAPTYPRTLDELPMNDQGATLQLEATHQVESAPDDIIVLTLTLSAGDRAIFREIEHRRTNVLPFLFAITADGKPVSRPLNGGSKEGGVNQFVELVPAHGKTTWTIRLAMDARASIIPADAKEVTLVAVFSDRQHEGYSEGGVLPMGEVWSSEFLKERGPQIVVRSNSVKLPRHSAR